MILNVRKGRPLPVYGDGKNVRDWIFDEDHCNALRLVLGRGRSGETYAIGGRCEKTNRDSVRATCDAVGQYTGPLPSEPREDLITYVTDRPGHDRRYAIDPKKMMRELCWQPEHDFQVSLLSTVSWYAENTRWLSRIQDVTPIRGCFSEKLE
jgi:dTDP-glucose 4,6-dehydratase